MLSVIVSRLLIVAFVGSVTLWYFITPYLVQPHKRIIDDLLTQTTLTKYEPYQSKETAEASCQLVTIENWTKWRLYVQVDDASGNEEQIVFGSSSRPFHIKNKAVIHMEWRPDYKVRIATSPTLAAEIDVPKFSFSEWGIYDHFFTDTDNEKKIVKVVPRFLFGIQPDTVETLYGAPPEDQPDKFEHLGTHDIVGRIPIIGLFSSSNFTDRVIIQIYMFIVICSIIFLLLVNNPPGSFAK